MRAALFPPKTPDLNPIENVWSILSRQVYARTKTYFDTASLLMSIEQAWASFKADSGLRVELIDSVTERLRHVVVRKGACADL